MLSPFRILFTLGVVMTALFPEWVFHLPQTNAIEKTIFLLAALSLLTKGELAMPQLVLVGVAGFGTFISAVMSSFPGFSWTVYIAGLVSLVTPLLYLAVVPGREDRNFALTCMALLPLLEIVIGLVYQQLGLHPFYRSGAPGEAPRLAGSSHPAFLGAAAGAGAVAALLLAEIKDKRYLLVLAANVIILLLTAARMASATSFITCAAIVVWRFEGYLRAKLIGAIYGSIAALAVGVPLAAHLVNRLESGNLAGRDVLWRFVDALHKKFPTFGIGLGGLYKVVPESVTAKTGTMAAHNEYLHYLVEVGWFGGLILLLSLLAIFATSWTSRRMGRNGPYLVGVLAFLAFCTTDNALARQEAFFLLIAVTFGCGMTSEELVHGVRQSIAHPVIRWRPRKAGNASISA